MIKNYPLDKFDVVSFDKDLPSNIFEKVVGYKHDAGNLAIYINDKMPLTSQEETDLSNYVGGYVYAPKAELRIYRVLPRDHDPLISDFSILGFKKVSPHYDRGRKTLAVYKSIDKDEIVVSKTFSDVRDENGILTGVEVQFDWYDEDNNIGLTKTEIVKNYNIYEAETEERKRRSRQLDFLIASAKGTAYEPAIDLLFTHYKNEIELYRESGNSSHWGNAMLNETNEEVLAILNGLFPLTSAPEYSTQVINSVKYQIGTMTEAELMATLVPTP